MSPRAIALTGAPGSGKTTVLQALAELLDERGAAYAAVDLDWLAWCNAPRASVAELLAANLRAVWANFERAGVDRLVLARHPLAAEELTGWRSALPGVELVAVRLELPRAVLEERVRARDEGAELAQHLALIDEIASLPPHEDAAVRADGLAPREVALAVLRAAGWS